VSCNTYRVVDVKIDNIPPEDLKNVKALSLGIRWFGGKKGLHIAGSFAQIFLRVVFLVSSMCICYRVYRYLLQTKWHCNVRECCSM
jgi:hypothetical protein